MGGPEIFLLVVLGVIFFGPEKLPDLARKLARVVNYLRGVANNARQTLSDELGPEFANMDLRDLNPRNFVAKQLLSDENAVTGEIRSVAEEVATAKTAAMSQVTPSPQPVRRSPGPAFDSEAT